MRANSIMNKSKISVAGLLLTTALAFAVTPASAAIVGPLAKTVAKGKDIFTHDTFGGSGLTCQSCHTAGGKGPTVIPGRQMQAASLANAAAVFPRYKPRDGKVMTLEDEIHGCIKGALGGKAPGYDSAAMRALVSYITSLSQGKPVDMGGVYR